MPDPRTAARAYGIAIELADYDPEGPVIRINTRVLPAGSSCEVREHIDRAVAHELYHHREALGEIARLPDRKARERAAGEYPSG